MLMVHLKKWRRLEWYFEKNRAWKCKNALLLESGVSAAKVAVDDVEKTSVASLYWSTLLLIVSASYARRLC